MTTPIIKNLIGRTRTKDWAARAVRILEQFRALLVSAKKKQKKHKTKQQKQTKNNTDNNSNKKKYNNNLKLFHWTLWWKLE